MIKREHVLGVVQGIKSSCERVKGDTLYCEETQWGLKVVVHFFVKVVLFKEQIMLPVRANKPPLEVIGISFL